MVPEARTVRDLAQATFEQTSDNSLVRPAALVTFLGPGPSAGELLSSIVLVVCADFPSRVGLRTPPAGSGQRYLAATRTVSLI